MSSKGWLERRRVHSVLTRVSVSISVSVSFSAELEFWPWWSMW